MFRALALLCLIFFPAFSPCIAVEPQAGRPLRVAAVQLSIHARDLVSFSAYREHIEALVQGCLEEHPDLILFPEYASAFLALIPYGALLERAETIGEALQDLMAREPLMHSLADLFLLDSGLAERAARELFGGLARRHRVAVGAGTLFAAEPRDGGLRLVNRALVFGRDGELLHQQDKVLLTDFERDQLQARAGAFEQAAPFVFEGRRIALTICRDTYMEEWERVFSGCDLWVDLKGNGQPFTEQARERFQRALPARLAGSGVPYGITVCLTGRLLELVWEGESFLAVEACEGKVRTSVRAASADGEEVLLIEVPPRRSGP